MRTVAEILLDLFSTVVVEHGIAWAVESSLFGVIEALDYLFEPGRFKGERAEGLMIRTFVGVSADVAIDDRRNGRSAARALHVFEVGPGHFVSSIATIRTATGAAMAIRMYMQLMTKVFIAPLYTLPYIRQWGWVGITYRLRFL